VEITATVHETRVAVAAFKAQQYDAGLTGRVGFVPTMGALHRGHAALIERMVEECDVIVVSIFVNPTQFGPNEDFAKYPKTFEADSALCERLGVDIIFAPETDEIYPDGYVTTVHVDKLGERWCGASRPGHFDGVATVVAKLFNIVQPDKAYFGEKDFQQLAIIRRMSEDLNLGVEVVGCPTVREADGLALSSRNAYLSIEENQVAPRLNAAMREMAVAFSNGETSSGKLEELGRWFLQQGGGPQFKLEYLAVVDPATLEPVEESRPDSRIMAAARLGTTRLIDNMAIKQEGGEAGKMPPAQTDT